MIPGPVFSEDFYNKSLLQDGKRVCINKNGSFGTVPKESKWNRFKRFLTFQQDPDIDKVHSQLKITTQQINCKSGPLFLALKSEVHAHGEAKFKCLEKNLKFLREKLDQVGQINPVSNLILKIVNFALRIFKQPLIEIKKYSTTTFQTEEFFWMANYFKPLSLSKYTYSSFNLNLNNIYNEGLKLTDKDKNTCIFSVRNDDPNVNEKFQELEKGLKTHCQIMQTHMNYAPQSGSTQILANLELTFDSEKKQFLLAIRNPRGREIISQALKKHLSLLPTNEKTVRYSVTADCLGKPIQVHELAWIIDAAENSNLLSLGSSAMTLMPDVRYEIFDESNNSILYFTLIKA